MGKLKYLISQKKFKLGKFLRKKKYVYDDKIQDIVNQVKEKGFAVVPNFYTHEECTSLRTEIDKLIIKKDKDNSLWTDSQGADKRCFAAEDDSELIKKYHTNEYLNSVADNVFEAKMTCSNTLAAKIEYKDKNIGSGGGWHRDGNHFQFKAIVYLSDVEIKDGPFQILEGSHKPNNILEHIDIMSHDGENLRFTNEQVEKVIKQNNDKYKVLTAKAGTLVFADVSAIHTGMPLSEGGERYTLFNYYYPSYENIEKRKKLFQNVGKNSEYI